ncbi:MAG: tRNA 2-thiouridine(34) synthase MnmA, partial [Propionibacteriaceae bacterium]|nr:tRNA 2-thiouridine(34) synthase MnmA [Propionibacteriaceae bacterium]
MTQRLVAALSGGVDSAVATARALEEGYEVLAVYLRLSMSARDEAGEARGIAEQLGVPFEVWDLSGMFDEAVGRYFLGEYARGRTPNPCPRCNERIKFGALLERAIDRGFSGVVTGHYARLVWSGEEVELHRGSDPAKDQSYVLARLDQAQLRRCVFPLGDATKGEVRAEAWERELLIADKADSTDICFIPDGDTAGYLRAALGERVGDICDEAGAALGQHRGAFTYTIGQRQGLRITTVSPDGGPRYVLRTEPETNTVV